MQLFQASTDALLKPLLTVVGIVERKTTMQILSNVLLKKEGDKMAFVANDMLIQITTHANFGVGDDVESVTVAARKLQDILRALPAAGQVSASVTDQKMTIQCSGSRFSLQTLPGKNFPLLPIIEQWQHNFTMTQSSLRRLFNMIHYAMAHQDIRFYLNGMLMVLEPGLVRAVATDGHRLAHAAEDVASVTSEASVIIPRKTVDQMLRLLDDSDAEVQISIAEGQIRFVFGDVELISKLVEGKFPDYKRVIPTDYTVHLRINREELLQNLQRAAILVSEDKLRTIKLHFGENVLRISSSNLDQEEAKMELALDYNGEPIDIGFNVTYLLDVLNTAKTEDVIVSLKGESNSPVLISLPNHEHFRYVVMPLRI
ncbi:DNA polymerase III subunit beta [Pelistega europaea]|uniref:Beta sliding clamp n=1 Tax=Pelistega europaea TaxID=106147 RepID=A0A7Y4L7T8_9BURK|nr:DNA polymerase III subunit beta [Pelistega europaea]NOL48542.1 DNA polymerase III subunit beta [Pelistega europaea]